MIPEKEILPVPFSASLLQTLQDLWSRALGAITLWRIMTVACIVFAAGISGTWFNDQFKDDLQRQRWGWFGATIAGVAIFCGVMLAVDSLEPIRLKRSTETDEEWTRKLQDAERIRLVEFWAGVAAVVIGVLADVAMSTNYFQAGHDQLTAIILGFYPSLLSIVGGVIEGVRGIRGRDTQAQKEERQEAWSMKLELEKEKLRIRGELAKEKLRLSSATNAALPAPLSADVHGQSANVRELVTDERDALRIIHDRLGPSFTTGQAEEASPFQRTKTLELLGIAADNGLLEKEGRGKWRFRA